MRCENRGLGARSEIRGLRSEDREIEVPWLAWEASLGPLGTNN